MDELMRLPPGYTRTRWRLLYSYSSCSPSGGTGSVQHAGLPEARCWGRGAVPTCACCLSSAKVGACGRKNTPHAPPAAPQLAFPSMNSNSNLVPVPFRSLTCSEPVVRESPSASDSSSSMASAPPSNSARLEGPLGSAASLRLWVLIKSPSWPASLLPPFLLVLPPFLLPPFFLLLLPILPLPFLLLPSLGSSVLNSSHLPVAWPRSALHCSSGAAGRSAWAEGVCDFGHACVRGARHAGKGRGCCSPWLTAAAGPSKCALGRSRRESSSPSPRPRPPPLCPPARTAGSFVSLRDDEVTCSAGRRCVCVGGGGGEGGSWQHRGPVCAQLWAARTTPAQPFRRMCSAWHPTKEHTDKRRDKGKAAYSWSWSSCSGNSSCPGAPPPPLVGHTPPVTAAARCLDVAVRAIL